MEPGDGLQDRPERGRCETNDCRDRNQEQDLHSMISCLIWTGSKWMVHVLVSLVRSIVGGSSMVMESVTIGDLV